MSLFIDFTILHNISNENSLFNESYFNAILDSLSFYGSHTVCINRYFCIVDGKKFQKVTKTNHKSDKTVGKYNKNVVKIWIKSLFNFWMLVSMPSWWICFIYSSRDWSHFYNDSSPSFIVKKRRNSFVNSSINISSSSSSTILLVEDTAFSRCFSPSDGGNIVFTKNGHFIQLRVCSYRSKSWKEGVYCKVQSSKENRIIILDTSISHSGDESGEGYNNIYCHGNVNISRTNNSFSRINYRCFFEFKSIYKESFVTFSSFSNNTQVLSGMNVANAIGISTVPFIIRFCNILNTIGSAFVILRSEKLNTIISNCSFKGNDEVKNRFLIISGTMIVEYCYIADSISDYPGTTADVQYPQTPFQTALLSHFSSRSCEAEFPIFYKYHVLEETEYDDFPHIFLQISPFFDCFFSVYRH